MISDQIVANLIAGAGGGLFSVLVALVIIVKYLDRRDGRNQESFKNLSEVYASVHRDLLASFERTTERLIKRGGS